MKPREDRWERDAGPGVPHQGPGLLRSGVCSRCPQELPPPSLGKANSTLAAVSNEMLNLGVCLFLFITGSRAHLKTVHVQHVCRHTPVILTLLRLRQEQHTFMAVWATWQIPGQSEVTAASRSGVNQSKNIEPNKTQL